MDNCNFEKRKILLYKKHEKIEFDEYISKIPKDYEGLVLKTIDRDAIGRSLGCPRWVKVYEYSNGKISNSSKIAIYKEPDYDQQYGPYAEKLWSIIGKLILPECRIPDIDITYVEREKEIPGVISYSIVDKEKEDMTDIRTILRYNSITEEMMKQNDDRLYIQELLNYIKKFVGNKQNFEEIKGQVIKAILLDCITNSFDRHPDNWALIHDEQNKKFTLGLYDNTVSFINIISNRSGVVDSGNWGRTFIRVKGENGKVTDKADEVIGYIRTNYPQEFEQFVDSLGKKLKYFSKIDEKLKIAKISLKLTMRYYYLKNLTKDREVFD